MQDLPIAVFFQAQAPPEVEGRKKPMKPGGYRDSGADIAFSLREAGRRIVTPVPSPNPEVEDHWVFPDTIEGFEKAFSLGARIFWLNTVLFEGHPIQSFRRPGLFLVGHPPGRVQRYDDKLATNSLLRENGLPVASSEIVSLSSNPELLRFPGVLKPIRGRGSEGVSFVADPVALRGLLEDWSRHGNYGRDFMWEEWLEGTEITIPVLPPGFYRIGPGKIERKRPWALPPVRRFKHVNGVAPYNGIVAVTENSLALNQKELLIPEVGEIQRACEAAAVLVGARNVIRIDCRQNKDGRYLIFDLNMKPNLTGAGRPGRDDQDSLVTMAAREIGWTYKDLLVQLVDQAWRMD